MGVPDQVQVKKIYYRCQHKFGINVALVRQFSAIKSKNCLRALGVTNLKISPKMSMYVLKYVTKIIQNFNNR